MIARTMNPTIILTGDRPTGCLHIGHYIGSLVNRIQLQHDVQYRQYIMIADMQALTDNATNPNKVTNAVIEVLLDYLAVGIDPNLSNIFLQSQIPELSELTMYYMNLVTLARLKRNPTVKEEMQQKSYDDTVPVGFIAYPIAQAADITAFKASLIPVGEDQIPVIEQTNEIVRKFNNTYAPVLVEAKALLSATPRVPGIDGKSKMSKSLNNAIYLSDDECTIHEKVMSMYTDANHLRITDPGKVEGNTVFIYLDFLAKDKKEVESLKISYQNGGLGDVKLKNYLFEILREMLAPIRQRRVELAKERKYLMHILQQGSKIAREVAANTLQEVKRAMGLIYY